MTKRELVSAILEDMHLKAGSEYTELDHQNIDLTWRGWLSRQTVTTLTEVLYARKREG